MIFKIVKAVRNLHWEGKNLFLNRDGSVLVTVVVTMAALLILGVSLSTLALNDQHQAVRQQKNNEAYYLARSGAEAVEAVLMKNISNVNSYFGEITEAELGNGKFQAKVIDGGDGTIVIESTGYAGNHQEKLTLTLTPEGEVPGGSSNPGFLPIFDMAVFSYGNIELTGSARVEGNVATNSVEPRAVEFGWSTSVGNLYIGPGGDPNTVVYTPNPNGNWQALGNLEDERLYPEPVFPEFPTGLPQRSNIIATGNQRNLQINEPGQYNEINITNSCKLTVNVGSSDLILRVKKFAVTGNAEVVINKSGDGRLILYVEDAFTSTAHFNEGGEPAALLIYYRGTTGNLNFSDWLQLPSHFFAQQANLQIGGSGGLIGNIITLGDSAVIKGGSDSVVRVIYAPNAHVEVSGGGGLRGAIVSGSCSVLGGAKVIYDSDAIEMWDEVPDFEFDLGAEPGEPGSGEGSTYDPGTAYKRVWSN